MPISKSKVTYKLDIVDNQETKGVLDVKDKNEIREVVAAKLSEMIIGDLNRALSPVTGKKFQGLSEDYKKKKQSKGGSSIADMYLKGDMQSDFEVKKTQKGIELGWFGGLSAKKAYNHTTGDTLPQRPLLPDERGQFRSGIIREIKKEAEKKAKEIIEKKLTKTSREIKNIKLLL